MESVFRLIKNQALRSVYNLTGYLFAPVSRQAVKHYRILLRIREELRRSTGTF